MKSFLVLIREIKEAFINIKRAGFLTFITILVITISLYSIGMIYFFYLYSNRVKEGIENRIEVSFYIEKSVTEERIEEIKKEISLLPEVENVRYISPEESLEELKKEYHLKPDEDIFYIGAGRFGIVEKVKKGKSMNLVIKRRIQYEEKNI